MKSAHNSGRYRRRYLCALLYLAFDDVEEDEPGAKAMTSDQAREIWRFLTEHRNIGAIICHCELGQNRSPAVAAAITEWLGGSAEPFFERYAPSLHVYEMLRSTRSLAANGSGRD